MHHVENKAFDLDIVSAEDQIYSGKATKLFAHGVQGQLEILCNHAPLMTRLVPGAVWVFDENDKEEGFVIFGGVLEVQPKITTILADAALRAEDIDEAEAQKAKNMTQEALRGGLKGDVDYAQVHAELLAAMAQLQVIRKLRNTLR